MKCRHCFSVLKNTFVDLGFAPPSNAILTEGDLNSPETYFPLKVKVCDQCWLVQTEDYALADELFTSEYVYFSSTSTSWLEHARNYAKEITKRLELNETSLVIEIASNDGYLLKNFIDFGIPCFGVEPTNSTANVAEKIGISVVRQFFGSNLAQNFKLEGKLADLIIGNNVYAHVPDINDFTVGLKLCLKPKGVITLEFPHLLSQIKNLQFDTIYHEHFSYLSLYTVDRIFKQAGLKIWDVEKIPTHGGSLRIYGTHVENDLEPTDAVGLFLQEEAKFGLQSLTKYEKFQDSANNIKNNLLNFLIEQKRAGKSVVAYGAAAKGSTLLNYAGIKKDLLPYICDASLSKQGKFMPGSHIPIFSPEILILEPPDFLLVLPWNLLSEIKQQNYELTKYGTKFVIAVPNLEIFA